MALVVPLIELHEIEAQAQVLGQLASRISHLPRLAELEVPIVFVGEGSSYNAVAWQLHTLRRKLPHKKIRLMYPWELEAFLVDSPIPAGDAQAPMLVAISQSGKTASLRRAVRRFYRTVPHAPKGLLITNAPDAASHEDWKHMEALALQAGEETAIAATKTFTATAYLVRALLLPLDTLQLLDVLPIGIATLLQALPVHPAWQQACSLIRSTMNRPMVLIGSRPTMPVLGELHLKLTETLSRPVLNYHNEGFKHGPRSVLHRTQQSHWPLQVYFPPAEATAREEFEADARLHIEHLPPEAYRDIYQLWIRPEGEDIPPPLTTSIPLLQRANVVELSLPAILPADIMSLIVIQRLAYDVVQRLGLTPDGLTKYVASI
jgi:fructoselysine-6-P-deglycase FrlB-like protein